MTDRLYVSVREYLHVDIDGQIAVPIEDLVNEGRITLAVSSAWNNAIDDVIHKAAKDLGHIDCPCWATGKFKRADGCKHHPWDL